MSEINQNPEPNQNLNSVLRSGFKLKEAEILACEEALTENEEDLTSRLKLLGFYWFNKHWDACVPHLIWLIDKSPESEVLSWEAATVGDQVSDPEMFKDLKNRWELAIKAPTNPRVLLNAAAFFLASQPERSVDLLEQAHDMDAADDEILEKLASTYQLALKEDEKSPLLAKALTIQKELMERMPESKKQLIELARLYLYKGETREAKHLVDGALTSLTGSKDLPLLAEAHCVRGLIYLEEGLLNKAKDELSALPSIPKFDLANKLIARGELKAVSQYLKKNLKHWKAGKIQLALWIAQLELGMKPELHSTWLLSYTPEKR
ncbi:MAG: hypothetical protein KC652_18470 [Cyanobacteria bacterium HKST-UBA01]|nr:hypothetical protein [Cyanobacteria bacterium HKST-UBA01]